MISSISVVSIYVEDQAKAETFWCDTIGFEVVRKAPFEGYFWIQVAPHKDAEEMGQTTLSLFPRALDKEWKEKRSSIVFQCDDIAAMHKRLQDKGVQITKPETMPWGTFCTFKDDDGNAFLLTE